MDVKEIEKHLTKENISPELKKALEQRKNILVGNKKVTK
jgi:hypothetical protein